MRLTSFAGIAPKMDPQDTGPQQAVIAENCELYGARIDPHVGLGLAGSVVNINGQPMTGEIQTLHRAGNVWIGFSHHTTIAPDPAQRGGKESFLFVQDGRLYRSSPRWVLDGQGPMLVGIDWPTAPPTAAVVGGTAMTFPAPACPTNPMPLNTACQPGADAPEARAYILTYVTTCDEESGPSTPSNVVSTLNGQAVALVDPNTPPANAVARRWYRSISNSDGKALWLLAGQTPISQPGFVDNVHPLALGGPLETENHLPPPNCLQGVAALGDSMIAVWGNDKFWLSEPRLPHAFPPTWRKQLRFPIVHMQGVTAFVEGDETFLGYITTSGTPYYVTGALPESVQTREYGAWEPAAGPRGHAVCEGGLVYASLHGLVYLSGSTVETVLAGESTDLEWQGFDPANVHLHCWNGRVWGFSPQRSFVFPLSRYRKDRLPALTTLTMHPDAAYASPDTPLVLAFDGVTLHAWGTGTDRMSMRWRSRVFTMPGHWWPAAMKVVADFPREPRALRDGRIMYKAWQLQHGKHKDSVFFKTHPELRSLEPLLRSMPPYIEVKVLSDGEVYYSRRVTSSRPFRVPAKRRGIDWQFEVSGNAPVRELQLETSISDLTQLGLGVGNSV